MKRTIRKQKVYKSANIFYVDVPNPEKARNSGADDFVNIAITKTRREAVALLSSLYGIRQERHLDYFITRGTRE